MPDDYDWTGVPADRVPAIRHRINILDAFLALEKPTAKARREAAEALGVRRAMFYRMLAAWRKSRRPVDLPGVRIGERSGRGRGRLPKQVEDIIGNAILALGSDAPPEKLVAEVLRRCAAASMKSPSRATIRLRRRGAIQIKHEQHSARST